MVGGGCCWCRWCLLGLAVRERFCGLQYKLYNECNECLVRFIFTGRGKGHLGRGGAGRTVVVQIVG